jgi:hypothetical protein
MLNKLKGLFPNKLKGLFDKFTKNPRESLKGLFDKNARESLKGLNARESVRQSYKIINESEVAQATRNWGTNLGVKTLDRLGDIPSAIKVMNRTQKATLGMVGLMMAGKAIESTYQSFNMGSHNTPPPAFQGAYGRIEAMRHTNPRRSFNSDFGSGLRLNRTARRKIMPMRHTQWS